MKIRFVMCDWKEQLDLGWLNESLRDVFNGKNVSCITQVDTGGDPYAVVVSGKVIDKEQAQKIYKLYDDLPDEASPYNKVLDIKWP